MFKNKKNLTMKRGIFTAIKASVLLLWLGTLTIGCANRGGGPQGGPVDSLPPILIKSSPLPEQTGVTNGKVVLEFNEIVLLEGAAQKVVVSPPQSTQPIVKAISHKVYVDIPDSLQPNTTYTIDFSDAIVDNNEKNKLENFSFSFSTGDVIDSLVMRGLILDAMNLNPVPDMVVGIHSDLSDSAFYTKPFDRITKSDKNGRFVIRNIKPGNYRIYGLTDLGGNYIYDMPNEQIAFQDTVYVPSIRYSSRPDTVWREVYAIDDTLKVGKPTLEVDSIIYKGVRQYEPRSILLKAFTGSKRRQYLVRQERNMPYRLDVIFNAGVDSLPQLEPLNFESGVLTRINSTADTITYWFTDTLAIKADTLISAYRYRKTDSVGELYCQTDTLRSIYLAPRPKNENRRGRQ